MSAIPSSAMPHAFAEEGVDLRDPNAGKGDMEEAAPSGPSMGLLLGGAALAYVLYRLVR